MPILNANATTQAKTTIGAQLTRVIPALALKTVGMDGYFLEMGEPARDMILPDAATTNGVEDPEQAINVGASWGIRFLTPEDIKKALPLYPGSGVHISNEQTNV